MNVIVEISARHLHLSQEHLDILFGAGHQLTSKKALSQPGQFACEEKVEVVGSKGSLKMSVLGPVRPATQVEISLTDARVLGLTPPVRPSGSVENSPGVLLKGTTGEVKLPQGVIAAQRHIHITPEDAKIMGVADKQIVKLQTYTSRPLVFDDVVVRVSPDFETFVHLDYDEANACGFKNGDLGRILP